MIPEGYFELILEKLAEREEYDGTYHEAIIDACRIVEKYYKMYKQDCEECEEGPTD